MTEIAQSIDLDLPSKLKDREYRRRFFRAESAADIARQLVELRERRGLKQAELADLVDTGQPAISRYESADYESRTIQKLREIAEALDARLRIIMEAAEDVLKEYESEPVNEARPLQAVEATTTPTDDASEASAITRTTTRPKSELELVAV